MTFEGPSFSSGTWPTEETQGSGLSYQWQWRADSSCTWGNSPLPGNQTASMNIPFTLDRIGNQYRCVITDANGNSVASDYGELRQADNNWTFTYDANGMRTSRTNGVTTYSYVYNGSKLSRMTAGANTLEFTYDGSGNPMSLVYNGTTYYYVTNLQGDVVAIVGSGGTVVVRYTYDAWGRVLTISGGLAMSIGHLNPLRYRGYVYDTDTELYYLQSRYYDPEMGRFINADAFASTGQGILGNNMFAYCNDSPVDCSDSNGNRPVGIGESNKFNYYVNIVEDGEDLEPPCFDHPLYYKTNRKTSTEGTLAVGLSGQMFGGAGGTISGFLATDTKGDVGLMYSWGIGGGLPSYGGSVFVSGTNAPSVSNLTGRSEIIGGGINVFGVSAGFDYFIFNDEENPNITYWGWTFAIGGAAEYPVETHGYVSFTDGIVIALWED